MRLRRDLEEDALWRKLGGSWQGVGCLSYGVHAFCKKEVFLPTLGVRKLLISLALCCMLVTKINNVI